MIMTMISALKLKVLLNLYHYPIRNHLLRVYRLYGFISGQIINFIELYRAVIR